MVSEMESIRQVLALEQHEKAQSWTSVFKKDVLQTRKRVGLAWFGLFMNQLSGINLGTYENSAMTMLSSKDCLSKLSLTSAISRLLPAHRLGRIRRFASHNDAADRWVHSIVSHLAFDVAKHPSRCLPSNHRMFPIGNLLPALALDRIGRRWTMIWGCAGLSICMMMLAALLSNGQKATASAAVTFFFLYMLIFGGTINVVPWGKQFVVLTTPEQELIHKQYTAQKSYRSRLVLAAWQSQSPPIGSGTSSSS